MRHVHFFLLALLGIGPAVFAQTDKALLHELAEENKKSVDALVLYPQDARLAILEATKQPELVVKMQSMQQKTTAAFRTLIEDFSRSTQAVFYDLTRYPGLVEALADRRESPDAVWASLQVLPEDKRQEAYGVVLDQMPTLIKINELNHTAANAFTAMLSPYPAPVRQAFQQLADLPEVLEILNEDLRFTILVGDTYREDPAWVLHKMDSLNLAVAREHAEELSDWKQTLENDPQAAAELEAASAEYRAEYGYDGQDYPYPQETSVERYYSYHYPWWYGYPWWEPYPRWRPYPYWYDWGFYPYRQTVVIIYMPSWHFMHWYFEHPRHHHHYNRLSTHFVNHYYGHRRSGTSITVGVGEWRDRNRSIVSDEWLADKNRLPERLREYGRFEEKRADYNTRNPKAKLDAEQYLEKNGRQYPELEHSRQEARQENRREPEKRSDWAPAKQPVPAPAPRTEKPPQTTPPTPPRREPAPPKDEAVDKAKDYHRQQWEQDNRNQQARDRREAAPQRQPAPQPKNQPAPAPRKQAEKPKPAPNRGRE